MILINETDKYRLSYEPATSEPLSSDVIVTETEKITWVFDSGRGEEKEILLKELYRQCRENEKELYLIISHFHGDHCENIGMIEFDKVFMSKTTYKYILSHPEKCGDISERVTIVDEMLELGSSDMKLTIFPIASSHEKGCLAVELDEEYVFVGDATYCAVKDNVAVYNVQLVQNEIKQLSDIKAEKLLISHDSSFVAEKSAVIMRLEKIIRHHKKDDPYVRVIWKNKDIWGK